MFNFAVNGSLERYQPIRREPSIPHVGPIGPAKKVGNIKASSEDNSEFSVAMPDAPATKSHGVKGYDLSASTGEPRQRRQAWTVADLMTKSVKTLQAGDLIRDARTLLDLTGFRHIPIVNAQRQVEGLISDRDLLRLSQVKEGEYTQPISSIMTKRVLTCFPETSLRLAAHTMLEEGFSSLPVVDPKGVLLGILTTGDILKALVNEAPVDLWA